MSSAQYIPRRRTGRRSRTEVVDNPTMGLFFDQQPVQIPKQALKACRNVRIQDGQIGNDNMGWETFPDDPTKDPINLDAEQVLLVDQFVQRSGITYLLFSNKYDLFRYVDGTKLLEYITPIYDTDTILSMSYAAGPDETTITSSGGTAWDTDPGDRNGDHNVIAGDMFHPGDASYQVQDATKWHLVKSVTSDSVIVVAGDATAGFSPSDPYTIRQRFTGDELDKWDSETFPAFDTGAGLNDHWYATNGVDYGVRYRGPTLDPDGATRVDLGFTYKKLVRFKNLMVYLNLLEAGESKPQAIRNSDVGKPEDVTNGSAKEFVPAIGSDSIVNAAPLGDFLVTYNEQSVVVNQWVGSPFGFVSRTASPSVGLFADDAFIDYGTYHEFLSHDARYRFNGVGLERSGDHVFREILRTISPSRKTRILTHIDEVRGEAHWVVPLTTDGTGSTGGPLSAYTEHYTQPFPYRGELRTPFTFRDLPATATGYFQRASALTWDQVLTEWRNTNFRWNDRFFEASFPFNLFGDSNGYVYILGTTDSQHNGVSTQPIYSFIRTGRRPVIDGEAKGVLKRFNPWAQKRATASYSLVVLPFLADREHGDETTVAGSFRLYDLTHAGERFVAFRVVARYVEWQLSTNGEQRPWSIDGWTWSSVEAGSR